jgi:hypothetical protein
VRAPDILEWALSTAKASTIFASHSQFAASDALGFISLPQARRTLLCAQSRERFGALGLGPHEHQERAPVLRL